MTDNPVINLLNKLIDSMVLLLKYCDIDEQTVHESITRSYANTVIPTPEKPKSPPLPLAHRNLLGRILSYWRTKATYVDEEGEPRPLPRRGPDPSFESLLNQAASDGGSALMDLTPDIAADLLVSHKSAELNAEGHIFPIAYYFRTNSDTLAGSISNLAYLAEFAGTAAHNALGGQGGRFNAVARVQALPAEQVPVINAKLMDQGSKFLISVDSFMESMKCTDETIPNLRNVGIGMYLIDEPHEPSE